MIGRTVPWRKAAVTLARALVPDRPGRLLTRSLAGRNRLETACVMYQSPTRTGESNSPAPNTIPYIGTERNPSPQILPGGPSHGIFRTFCRSGLAVVRSGAARPTTFHRSKPPQSCGGIAITRSRYRMVRTAVGRVCRPDTYHECIIKLDIPTDGFSQVRADAAIRQNPKRDAIVRERSAVKREGRRFWDFLLLAVVARTQSIRCVLGAGRRVSVSRVTAFELRHT